MKPAVQKGWSEYLTINEAAEFMGVNPSTLRNWDKSGRLKPRRHPINGYRMYRQEDLLALLENTGAEQQLGPLLAPHAGWSDMEDNEHFVQFYEDDGVLAHSVAGYIAAGLRKGQGGFVVATPAHRRDIETKLSEIGIDLAAAMQRGQYLALDAATVLRQFMVKDTAMRERFLETLTPDVSRMAEAYGSFRAFGEMVTLLWEEGKRNAAIQLEGHWNALNGLYSFSLFCAYPIRAFADLGQDELFQNVCGCHSKVIPSESYSRHITPQQRMRAISLLQQKAASLDKAVSRRDSAEASLALRERELTDFFDNAAIGIHKVGPDGTILWANRAELDMLGYAPEEYIGHNIAEFHAELPMIASILYRLYKGGEIRNQEVRLIAKNGEIRHALLNSDAYMEEGHFHYTRCFTRDITDQKQAEAALRESETQLKLVLDHAPVLVARCDKNQRFQYVNRCYAAHFGRQPEDFLQREVKDCLGGLYPFFAPHIATVLSGRPVEFEVTMEDGRFMHCNYEPEIGPSGEVAGWVSVIKDMTGHKKAEEEHVQGLIRLNELAGRLASMHDTQPMMQAILSTLADLHHASHGLLTLYNPQSGGLDHGATLGFSGLDKESLRVTPGIGPCGAAFIQKRRMVVEDTETDPDFAPFRDFSRKHGFRAVHSSPLLNRRDECLGVLTLQFETPRRPTEREIQFVDICTRQAADFMERLKAESALIEADRRKDEFLATLAHELRNPLAPIRNAIEVLRTQGASPRLKDEASQLMQRQAWQMQRLIDDLMDVSRISQGKIELQKQRVPLEQVLSEAIETVRPLIDAKGHELLIDRPSDPIWLEADIVRLSQVFANLLNNAAKYTPENGRVSLSIRKEGKLAAITIADNGIGIPAHMLSPIFETFVQVDTSLERKHGGLGIGLTLVKKLVQMHGGSVEAQSMGEGKGSTFVIRLPACKEEAAQPARTRPKRTSQSSQRVLLVDDNEASAKTLGWTLELLGHEVALAHTPEEGLALSRGWRPAVILLDIGLPGMNGYDLCRKMRQQEETKAARIIAQTGWGQQEHRKRSRDAGFDHHLVKPIDMDMLKSLLEAQD